MSLGRFVEEHRGLVNLILVLFWIFMTLILTIGFVNSWFGPDFKKDVRLNPERTWIYYGPPGNQIVIDNVLIDDFQNSLDPNRKNALPWVQQALNSITGVNDQPFDALGFPPEITEELKVSNAFLNNQLLNPQTLDMYRPFIDEILNRARDLKIEKEIEEENPECELNYYCDEYGISPDFSTSNGIIMQRYCFTPNDECTNYIATLFYKTFCVTNYVIEDTSSNSLLGRHKCVFEAGAEEDDEEDDDVEDGEEDEDEIYCDEIYPDDEGECNIDAICDDEDEICVVEDDECICIIDEDYVDDEDDDFDLDEDDEDLDDDTDLDDEDDNDFDVDDDNDNSEYDWDDWDDDTGSSPNTNNGKNPKVDPVETPKKELNIFQKFIAFIADLFLKPFGNNP